MQQSIRLGKIWNIPIGFNASWLLIFAFITYSLASGYLPNAYPELSTGQYWLLGGVTSLLFFGSVVFHELAHAWMALRYSVPVRHITLFLFGGVAEMEEESPSASAEFWIAIFGPLASLFAVGVFYAAYLLGAGNDLIAAPMSYLYRINLALAAFNMIPGFPLDGGRVLRAIVWRFTNEQRGTQIATRTGEIVALGFVGVGVVQALTGSVSDGLWLIFIGWFLKTSASAYGQHARLSNVLDGTTVDSVMQKQWREIDGKLPVSMLVDEHVSRGGPSYYFVRRSGYGYEQDESLHGMLTVTDINDLAREKWAMTPSERLMTAWQKLITISPSMTLMEALHKMDERNINHLPVMVNDDLIGVVTRDQVVQYLQGNQRFA